MSFTDKLKRWFGYSRRERTGSFILCLILMVVVIFRLRNQGQNDKLSEVQQNEPGIDIEELDLLEASSDTFEYVYFDPNTVPKELLLKVGLNDRQATTLINYRTSGGKFFDAEDFRKIYGISEEQQDRLIPYIRIIPDKVERKTSVTVQKESAEKVIEKNMITGRKPEPEKVHLNAGDSSDFEQLPGIGPVLSSRIIKYRALLGGFTGISQLSEVYGLRGDVIEMNRKYFINDTSQIKPLLINSLSYYSLLRHPYIDRHQAETIIRYRNLEGSFNSIDELVRNNVFSLIEINRLKPYISFHDSLKTIE